MGNGMLPSKGYLQAALQNVILTIRAMKIMALAFVLLNYVINKCDGCSGCLNRVFT